MVAIFFLQLLQHEIGLLLLQDLEGIFSRLSSISFLPPVFGRSGKTQVRAEARGQRVQVQVYGYLRFGLDWIDPIWTCRSVIIVDFVKAIPSQINLVSNQPLKFHPQK